MTSRPPYQVDAIIIGHIKPKNTFSWLFGVSETNEIKDKKASKSLFYPVIPPIHIPKVVQGPKWPPGHPTMLMLSSVGFINPKNTFSWLLGVSGTNQFKPEKASKP